MTGIRPCVDDGIQLLHSVLGSEEEGEYIQWGGSFIETFEQGFTCFLKEGGKFDSTPPFAE
jgi:hypothetical protein